MKAPTNGSLSLRLFPVGPDILNGNEVDVVKSNTQFQKREVIDIGGSGFGRLMWRINFHAMAHGPNPFQAEELKRIAKAVCGYYRQWPFIRGAWRSEQQPIVVLNRAEFYLVLYIDTKQSLVALYTELPSE